MIIKKQKSIRSSIYTIVIFVIILMFGANIISSFLINMITKDYNQVMSNSIILSQLSVELQNSYKAIDVYILTDESKYIEQFKKANQQVESILKKVDNTIELNEKCNIFFRNLKNMYENYIKLSDNLIAIKNKNNVQVYNTRKNLRMQYYYMNSHSQLLIKEYLHYSSMIHKETLDRYNNIKKIVYFIIILLLLISILAGKVLLNRVLKSIEQLCNKAVELSKKNWDVEDIKESHYEEINTLAKAFNNMKYDIKKYIEEVKQNARLKLELKETQLAALQMQMNPHFLFNTLNIISRIALFQDIPEIIKLVEAISKILRYNLMHKGELVSLSDEINVLQAYTFIQEIRFQDTVTFYFDIGKFSEVKISPMILQPIVENAIKHGLRNKREGGIINIKVKEKEKYIEIAIEDNGIGMISENKEVKTESSGIGLENVKKRMEIVFNRDDLVRIDSKKDKGTKITIIIPIDEDGAKDD